LFNLLLVSLRAVSGEVSSSYYVTLNDTMINDEEIGKVVEAKTRY